MTIVHAQEPPQSNKLLDKIVAVVNTRVIALSELKRMAKTIDVRKEISPAIYSETKYTSKELLDLMIRGVIVRDKINSQGYVINDDAVESRIKMTEDRLGLRRSDLLQFLKGKGVTYEEYFEIIRETMEFNIFAQRIIAPLISVTEQEIKNEFYKRNAANKALSFKYHLVDFYVPAEKILDKDDNKFLSTLKDYQLTGKLPEEYRSLETNNLENLNEDSISPELSRLLKTSTEGSFTKSIKIGKYVHVFYIQKKDLVESQHFLKFKEQIQNEIFSSKGKAVTANWFEREFTNYYIKNLL